MQDRDSASVRAGSWRTDSVTLEEMSESDGENLLGMFLKSQFLFLTSKWINLIFSTKLDSQDPKYLLHVSTLYHV